MRRRAIAASLGSGTTRATAATVFLTNFATPCAQGDAHAPKGEISVQNVLEEINKGFKTSAHDDKVIHRIFERIDYKKDNKIDKEELEHTLRSLGYEPVRVNQYGISEVEQMIWEVDEDCDGCVSLEEFQQMFDRGRNDKTGNEPRKLFNLCQFMVLDRDGDGSVSPSPTSQSVRQPLLLALTTQHVVHIQVSTEECMEMIMHRYGPDTLKKLWKESSHVQEREITLSDFLLQVNRSSQKAAREANKEKNLPAIKKRVNPQK